MQEWTIDLDAGRAWVSRTTYRQLTPRGKSLDIRAIAGQITAAISEEADELWLEWSRDRSEVRVLSSYLINPDHAPKATLDGRRKRLKRALDDELEKIGWVPMRQPGRYRRTDARTGSPAADSEARIGKRTVPASPRARVEPVDDSG
jgi:hypothetical protein